MRIRSAKPTNPIRSLERHRASIVSNQRNASEALSVPLLISWIHHDNMLEGVRFRPEEIAQALLKKDEQLPRYLHPLMEEIRRYEQAIKLVVRWSKRDTEVVTSSTLRRIHKLLTVDSRDWRGVQENVSCSPRLLSRHLRARANPRDARPGTPECFKWYQLSL